MTSNIFAGQARQSARSLISGMSSSVYCSITNSVPCNVAFAIGCSVLGAASLLVIPSYYPLLQPDSFGYISFDRSRTAFYPLFLRALSSGGLNLEQITYVQIAVFHIALIFLLLAVLRAGCGRLLVFTLVVALEVNVAYSSLHRSILTEFLFFSLSAVLVTLLLHYFRTGRPAFIAGASLCVGMLYGIRPAAITLAPMLFVAVWLNWHKRNGSPWVLLVALMVPLAGGPIMETIVFRMAHADHRASIVPNMMMGKAAMVIRSGTSFSGPYAETLNVLGAELYTTYAPVHRFLSHLPSIVAWPVASSTYEAVAQFSILNEALAKAANRTGLSQDWLREELGRQAIEQNFTGFLQLSLLNYFGQWSVTALTFPPVARSFNEYVDTYPSVPLEAHLSSLTMRPPSSNKSYFTYPIFLCSGLVSLVLGIGLSAFLWKPRLAERPRFCYLVLAVFFAAMCQVHTITISFLNVATPRFLMAVYPQLLLMFVFLSMAIFPALARAQRASLLSSHMTAGPRGTP